jgi:2',3'-cyclic-nucleotide 2'-phosphodiesterase (5'-nucleotidase family)
MRRLGILGIGLVLFLAGQALFASGLQERPEVDAVFVNMADLQSGYERYPELLTAVTQIADGYSDTPLVILINGDLFESGNVVAQRSAGAADYELLRRLTDLGTVVLNLGNHEFDIHGPAEFVSRAEELGVRVIGTIRDADTGELIVPASTRLSAEPGSVTVLGVATDQMNTYPEGVREAIQIPDPIEWVRSEAEDHVGRSDAAIVLSHAGLSADRELLRALPQDRTLFAVGGHDHLRINTEHAGIPYMHNGFKAGMMRVTELAVRDGRVELTHRAHEMSDFIPQAPFEGRIAGLLDEHLQSEERAVVGRSPEDMTVLEAARWAVDTLAERTGADVALLNHTSFGAGLPEGPVSRFQFDQFLRFNNDVVQAELSGETLRTIMEVSNQGDDTPLAERTGDFVYASDVSVDPDESYTVVTSGWVASSSNQQRYLGTSGIDFTPMNGAKTKTLLAEALSDN